MADGTYCDVISGSLENGACTGYEILVSGGSVSVWIPTSNEDPMISIHECKYATLHIFVTSREFLTTRQLGAQHCWICLLITIAKS